MIPQYSFAYDENLVSLEVSRPCAINYGNIMIQTYGSFVGYYDLKSKVIRSENYMGPVNVINPDPGGGGLVVNWKSPVSTGAYVYNSHGHRLVNLEPVIDKLPKEYTGRSGMVHHDFIRTKWGTLLFIYGYWVNAHSMDDLIVEVNNRGEILKILSLGNLILGDDQNITGLGFWKENWIHTNSLDTRYRGNKKVILVSLRNLDRLVEIYWDDNTIRRFIGYGILQHAHHAKYFWKNNEKRILVYNNGVYRNKTGIIEFDEKGEYVNEIMTHFFSSAFGSSQLLPNGNYLVTQGTGKVHEITSDGYVCRTFKYQRKEYVPFMKGEYTFVYRAIWNRNIGY